MTVHGASRTPEYISWKAMRWRGSGHEHVKSHYQHVTIDPRWDTFETFLADMGPKPHPKDELDRKNSLLGYCKDNCRWLSRPENLQRRWDGVRGVPGKAESGIDRRFRYRPVLTDPCNSWTVEQDGEDTSFPFGALELAGEPLYVPPF
jgi:hypothetical protein